MGFLMTLLDCIFSEVILSAIVCTNKAFEQSLQKICRLYEMQRNLWNPRWILLCGKGICSTYLHTFRTVKENATPFDIVKLPKNRIHRGTLERAFPHFSWSALWEKTWQEVSKPSDPNSPWDLVHLGWHSLDYLVLYLASLSLSWKKSL